MAHSSQHQEVSPAVRCGIAAEQHRLLQQQQRLMQAQSHMAEQLRELSALTAQQGQQQQLALKAVLAQWDHQQKLVLSALRAQQDRQRADAALAAAQPPPPLGEPLGAHPPPPRSMPKHATLPPAITLHFCIKGCEAKDLQELYDAE